MAGAGAPPGGPSQFADMLNSFPKLPPIGGSSSFFHQNDPFEPDYMGDNLMYLSASPNPSDFELTSLRGSNPFDSIVGKYTHQLNNGPKGFGASFGDDSAGLNELSSHSKKSDEDHKREKRQEEALKKLQNMVEKLGTGQEALGAMVEESKKDKKADMDSLFASVQQIKDTIVEEERQRTQLEQQRIDMEQAEAKRRQEEQIAREQQMMQQLQREQEERAAAAAAEQLRIQKEQEERAA